MKSAFAIGCLLLAGCSDAPSVSLLDRLNSSRPLRTVEANVSELLVNGEPMPTAGQTRCTAGTEFTIAGQLLPGTWGLSRITTYWKADDPSQPVVIRSLEIAQADRPLTFALCIYSGDAEIPEVIHQDIVQVRSLAKAKPPVLEFRTNFTVPEDPGEYAADLERVQQDTSALCER
jgi:hypothetical protein